MLVLITLSANGTMRFSDIHKTIADVSQRMLTVTLRTLESDGLIERKIYGYVLYLFHIYFYNRLCSLYRYHPLIPVFVLL